MYIFPLKETAKLVSKPASQIVSPALHEGSNCTFSLSALGTVNLLSVNPSGRYVMESLCVLYFTFPDKS
jgi:hypothetical protein